MTNENARFQPSPGLRRRRPPGCQNLSPLTLLLLACGCLCLQIGCLAIPIPQGYRNIETYGKKVEQTQLSFVVPGQTTTVEVIEKMGQPNLMLEDLGVMAYGWKMLVAYVPYVICHPTGAGGVDKLDRQYLLLMSYDDRGVINRYEIVRYSLVESSTKTIEELTRQWAVKEYHLRNTAQ
jgi:hypothetical protein